MNAEYNSMLSEGWKLEHTYAELPEIFYRNQSPETPPSPQMVIFNHGLAEMLGLNTEKLKTAAQLFSGAGLPHGAKPISQAYAGYQFGHFAMLGDGRAVLLGEQIAPNGLKFDIQLKGSGKTPFSRGGDGYAALSPMLREYIISEAMHSLGIPTTRSLAVAFTGKSVIREKIQTNCKGQQFAQRTINHGAVLTRVASSHIRVGTFNYISAFGTLEDTRILADYSINRHFPELQDEKNKYTLLLREVARLQASLIAKWQLTGFIHGVMNTDNMAISGETIDFGPCAFMDTYSPDTVFSSIDTAGRYAYENQPKIGAWNLSRFADSILPLIHEKKEDAIAQANKEIEYYWKCYNANWLNGMRTKLGIVNAESDDILIITEFMDLMAAHKIDYTSTFRMLSFPIEETSPLLGIPDFTIWREKWQSRVKRQAENPMDIMKKHNPAIIPRNYRVEEALEAAEQGDFSVMHNLLAVLCNPYEDCEEYAQPPALTNRNYKTFCGT